jgi:uncharacterized glyoxalase superfamily protein PhnB
MSRDGWRWVELKFARADTSLHLVRGKEDAPAHTPDLVLVKENAEATVRTLKSEGVKIITQPHRAPWMSGRIVAEFQDSEGIAMMIGSK